MIRFENLNVMIIRFISYEQAQAQGLANKQSKKDFASSNFILDFLTKQLRSNVQYKPFLQLDWMETESGLTTTGETGHSTAD